MIIINHLRGTLLLLLLIFVISTVHAQPGKIEWSADGNSFYKLEQNELVQYKLPANTKSVLLTAEQLTPKGESQPIKPDLYSFSNDGNKVLIYTNATRVWRINTRGDYWVADLNTKELKKLGKDRPASSLMFAKFSPDGTKVAYVSAYNVYVEDLASQQVKALTTDGTRKFINGTFDWVYEEEFA